jgi:isopentenyl-diphosphate delta-isomerase
MSKPTELDAPAKHAASDADSFDDALILVDADDNAIGTAPKLAVHQQGLRHRAISVIVRDRQGRLLLQQRAAGKYHSPGLWTNTCCSHPRPGESTADAAVRRLNEEMGFTCPLQFLFPMPYRADVSNGLIEDEITHVFAGRFDGEPRPDPREVSDWSWRQPDELARNIEQHPDRYTVWFRKLCRDHWREISGR